ncbi:MAG: SH3 domain-containing protein [Lachnospiraceae bacterium]
MKKLVSEKIIIAIPLVVIIIVMILVAKVLNGETEQVVDINTEEAAVNASAIEETAVVAIVDNPLLVDEYEEINELILTYLNALADGDVDTIANLSNNVSDTEMIRIAELGKHIESFPEYNVFTKIGPAENSFVVYAAARSKMEGLDTLIPGIYCFYVCMDSNGNYYLNEGILTDEEAVYIEALELDDSIISLLDSIDQEYEEMLAVDETVQVYMDILLSEIRDAVGTTLVEQDESLMVVSEEETQEESTDETILATSCTATLTDTLNVRKSDSEGSDVLGKLEKGTVVEVIEMRVNGWSKISYEGEDAYLKTDYLNVIITEEISEEEATGTVVAITKINIRSQASAASDKLGELEEGETLPYVEDAESGFCKVIYNGTVAYVAAEYVEIQ